MEQRYILDKVDQEYLQSNDVLLPTSHVEGAEAGVLASAAARSCASKSSSRFLTIPGQ